MIRDRTGNRNAGQQHAQNRWNPASLRINRAGSRATAYVLQWTTAAVLGLGLAIYLLVGSSLRPDWMPFFALAALFPFVALIIGNLRKLLLAIILLELPLQLDISLYHNGSAQVLGAIGGLIISLTTFCLAALYALWAVELLTETTHARRSWFRTTLPMTMYLLTAAISVTMARDVNLAIFELFLVFESFLLSVYIIKAVRSRQDLLFVLTMLLVGLALQGAVMIGVRAMGHTVYVSRITVGIDASGRVGGTIGSPNGAASYLTLLLAPALSVLLTRLRGRTRWLAVLAFGLGMVALVLTFSRGGWLACALSLMLLCLFTVSRGWLSARFCLTVASAIVLLYLLFGTAVLARLTGDDAGAAASRITLAELALRIVRDHPLLGVGANNYTTVFEQYVASGSLGGYVYTVHNRYLLVWAETGILGLLAFVGLLLAYIRRGWQTWMRGDRLLSPLALGLTAAIVGQMAHMFFDIFHGRPQVQMLWLVGGLLTAMRHIDDSAATLSGRSK